MAGATTTITPAPLTRTAVSFSTVTQATPTSRIRYQCATLLSLLYTVDTTTTISFSRTQWESTVTSTSTRICPGFGGFPYSVGGGGGLGRMVAAAEPTAQPELDSDMARPVKTATTEPILILIASWLCFVFAVQYIFLEAFSVVYGEGYGFNTGQTGLAFIPIAIGIFSSIFFLYPANKHYARKQHELGGETSPEARLPLTKLSAPMLIVSL